MNTTKKVTISWTHGSYKTWGEYLKEGRDDQVEEGIKQAGLKTAYKSFPALDSLIIIVIIVKQIFID